MRYLLDTNVISEVRKRRPDATVERWFDEHRDEDHFVSALVFGEVRIGIERLRHRDQRQADALESWLHTLRTTFDQKILSVTAEIAEEWARMNVPDPVPVIDGLMAATAKVHDLIFVTRDTGQFEQRGVRVLNPFIPPEAL